MIIYWIILIAAILTVVTSSIIDNNRFITTEYKVISDKITKNCRIAFLSDLHCNSFGRDNERLIEAVRKAGPDIIIMGGDMVTSHAGEIDEHRLDIPVRLVEALQNYRIFYGIGNHEYRMYLYREDFEDSFDVLMDKLASHGVSIMRNNSEYLDEYNIDIQGLEIERDYYKRGRKVIMDPGYVKEMAGERDGSHFRILMAHNPEYFDIYSKEADLVLSGHYHGGIGRLPILGGAVSPRLRLFPVYDGGKYEKNGSVMIVSKGLGSHTIPIRVFNPCELCIIDIDRNQA